MRTSTDRFPEHVDFYCWTCEDDYRKVEVLSIESDEVRTECPGCGDGIYVRAID